MIGKVLSEIRLILLEKFGSNSYRSYAQEGEDLILKRLLEDVKSGFYIDVGAHHPLRFSNTHFFYRKGWSGINIDAMPGSMKAFSVLRKRDINLELPISNSKDVLTYYCFNEPALNGFSKVLSEQRDGKEGYEIVSTRRIQTYTLTEILDEYLPYNTVIDFLTVDVEGLDYNVLESLDFSKYQPKYVLVEILNTSLAEIETNEIYQLLRRAGYHLISKSVHTAIFSVVK